MKKVFSLLLALSMLITGSFGVMAQAQTIEPTNFDEINFQITSKENPDAYIESRFVPGNSAYARSSEEDGKTLVGYVDGNNSDICATSYMISNGDDTFMKNGLQDYILDIYIIQSDDSRAFTGELYKDDVVLQDIDAASR